MKEIIEKCISLETQEALTLAYDLYKKGYNIGELSKMFIKIIKDHDMEERKRIKFMTEAAYFQRASINGIGTLLQLAAFICRIGS